MTELLKKAINEAEALPEDEQDSFAQIILDEIHSEQKWDKLFEMTSDKLEAFAQEVRQQTRNPMDESRL